eukprot:TRINITY_DN92708_c0_g1_i1.p1 TRINITY_DN92708_c0_g1~~TRINITY_DN92708_c0_g1_i1.p1  ORF type:complete len:157 (+),score=36.41 TRINITY_DN92708_c0_g1_i1:95-565(+)
MPHCDGEMLKYGATLVGTGGRQKMMPAGVKCEELEDFSASSFRNSVPKQVQIMLQSKGKGAEDTYNKFVAQVLTKQTWKKNFKWREVQGVVEHFRPSFRNVGMNVFLCNVRLPGGPNGGGGFYYWFEYVDLDVCSDYSPDEIYDPSKDACCTCAVM